MTPRTLTALKLGVVAGALFYLLAGFYIYWHGDPDDLERRWREAGYVIHGHDPIETAQRGEPILEKYGRVQTGEGYPPWSYFYAQFLIPPQFSLSTAKWIFFIIILLGLFALVFPVREAGRQLGAEGEWIFLWLAVLCCSSLTISFRHGQYGTIITVSLWLFLYFEAKGMRAAAGFFLGLAALKPQLAALFFLMPLARGSLRTFGWAVLFVCVATGVVCWQSQRPPWLLLNNMMNTGLSHYFYMGIGDPLKDIMGRKALLLASASVFGASAFFLLLYHRKAPLFEAAAIPSVFTTIWMNHHNYDLMIVSFLLVAILCAAIRSPRLIPGWAGCLTAFSYCFPHLDRYYRYLSIPALYRLFWLFALLLLLRGRLADPTENALSITSLFASGTSKRIISHELS